MGQAFYCLLCKHALCIPKLERLDYHNMQRSNQQCICLLMMSEAAELPSSDMSTMRFPKGSTPRPEISLFALEYLTHFSTRS